MYARLYDQGCGGDVGFAAVEGRKKLIAVDRLFKGVKTKFLFFRNAAGDVTVDPDGEGNNGNEKHVLEKKNKKMKTPPIARFKSFRAFVYLFTFRFVAVPFLMGS